MKLRKTLTYDKKDIHEKLWKCWRNLIQRTESVHPWAKYYEGITVDPSWHDFAVFRAWAQAAGWKPGLTLDRRDNNGNYEPGNCRFCTMSENQRNTRRAILVELHGEIKPLADWADRYGVDYCTAWRQWKVLHLTAESIFLRRQVA